MNHTKTRTSQAGFSLVELMVVVAIIGVLASIAVPQVNKYIAKARQSEAKTMLSSIYTSEKAFFAEYNAYDARFGAVGYSPEGKLRYNAGFATSAGTAIATAANGYNPTTAPAAVSSTLAYCGSNGAMTAAQNCTILRGVTNAAPGAVSAAAVVNNAAAGGAAFVGEATANIYGTTADVWRINNQKVLDNFTPGIN